MVEFEVLDQNGTEGPRLGRLAYRDGHFINTPHYVAISSRGIVPHITQDTMGRSTVIQGVYSAVEDFTDKMPPPVMSMSGDSILRTFTAMSEDQLLILGPRRCPPVATPASNTDSDISISASTGFARLDSNQYVEIVEKLNPDIAIGLADLPPDLQTAPVGRRRLEKMSPRTESWSKQLFDARAQDAANWPSLFMPVLPIELHQQTYYLEMLGERRELVDGLVIYDASTIIEDLPDTLKALPRLSLSIVTSSPHDILRLISRGVDVLTAPFLNAATDAGIALDFSFPPEGPPPEGRSLEGRPPESRPSEDLSGVQKLPLGIDMWQGDFAVDISPLNQDCRCYACQNHHKAYIRHLLSAKEMLAWVLLQIHNLATMDKFFDGIRSSIKSNRFTEDMQRFSQTYEARLPEKTGQGPRVRGYQFKSEGPGEQKKNAIAFRSHLNEQIAQNTESVTPDPAADGQQLQASGFAEVVDHSQL